MTRIQEITLELDGITAGDYLAHFLDADPQLAGTRLHSVRVASEPLDDSVVATLRWDGAPPEANAALAAAGFHVTGDVAAVSARVVADARSRARTRRSLALAAAA
jgi:hypothetical protein